MQHSPNCQEQIETSLNKRGKLFFSCVYSCYFYVSGVLKCSFHYFLSAGTSWISRFSGPTWFTCKFHLNSQTSVIFPFYLAKAKFISRTPMVNLQFLYIPKVFIGLRCGCCEGHLSTEDLSSCLGNQFEMFWALGDVACSMLVGWLALLLRRKKVSSSNPSSVWGLFPSVSVWVLSHGLKTCS